MSEAPKAPPLEVTVSLVAQPHLPLILASAGFLTTLKNVEEQIAALKITDAQSAQQAADLQQRLTDAGKKLDDTRLQLKRPFMEQAAAIDTAAKGPKDRIDAAKNTLKRALTTFASEEEARARKAEADRQAELKRLEEIRLEEERAAQEKADKLAKEAAALAAANPPPAQPSVPVWDDEDGPPEPAEPAPPPPPTATEQAIAAVKFAPAVVPVKPTGIRYKVTLVPTVVDVKLLPDCFIERIAKLGAIKSTFCQGWKEGDPLPECPGVTFKMDKTAESTGRALF